MEITGQDLACIVAIFALLASSMGELDSPAGQVVLNQTAEIVPTFMQGHEMAQDAADLVSDANAVTAIDSS